MAAFAGLTEAQRERLEMLVEEAGEIVQAGTKILRHGRDSHHPDDPKKTPNMILLMEELLELWAVYERMCYYGDIGRLDFNQAEEVWMKKRRYTHHQPSENPKSHPSVRRADER